MSKKPRGPAFALVTPQSAGRLLENAGCIETLVNSEQLLQRMLAVKGRVLATRQQRVFLAHDVAAILAAEPNVLGFTNVIERVGEMAQEMELVEHNGGLRCARPGGVAERLLHVHHGQANSLQSVPPKQMA